ncbi:MAG: NAD(+) synthase [bacterium]
MSSLDKLKSDIILDVEEVSTNLQKFIKNHVKKLDREGVILGLSGGIDSAVVASLCHRVVSPENMLALIMPERDTKRENVSDALNFAKSLGIKTKLIDISPHLEKLEIYQLIPLGRFSLFKKMSEGIIKGLYKSYEKKTRRTPFSESILGFKGRDFSEQLKRFSAYYRAKHRLRMLILYLYAELENCLVVGCANKTEYMIGFFVKHGCDDCADIMPLLGLYKTQVIELARYLYVPSNIIDKPPSPDIIPGITDELAIGMTYEKLDLILVAIESGFNNLEIENIVNVGRDKIKYVRKLIRDSDHMRNLYVP